jgi:signal-transduction protein with cAMP-binding, CBS, and nucleotidyltransferase domain
VVDNGRLLGILTQDDLIRALRERGDAHPVGAVMQTSFASADLHEMVEVALQRLGECRCHTLPVLQHGELAGLLTMENVGEFMRIQAALGR